MMQEAQNGRHRRSFVLLTFATLFAGFVDTVPARADEKSVEMTEQAVLGVFNKQLAAMVAGDTQLIGAMLDKGFVLTHLTGYRQPKEEWLAQMREGRFIYHSMEVRAASVELYGIRARLMGDTQTDSTVRCLIPGFDGALSSQVARDALWARFFMGAPRRQRQSVERYSIVKRA